MILNLALADVMANDRMVCAWPECERLCDARGFCDKHYHRMRRGRAPGCESSWDELATAALAWAGAETDRESKKAEAWLKKAALEYGITRAKRDGHL